MRTRTSPSRTIRKSSSSGRKVQATIPNLKKVVVTSEVSAMKEMIDLACHADDYLFALRKLQAIPMNLETLERTKVGRSVTPLKQHENPAVSALARAILTTWKATAKRGIGHRNGKRPGSRAGTKRKQQSGAGGIPSSSSSSSAAMATAASSSSGCSGGSSGGNGDPSGGGTAKPQRRRLTSRWGTCRAEPEEPQPDVASGQAARRQQDDGKEETGGGGGDGGGGGGGGGGGSGSAAEAGAKTNEGELENEASDKKTPKS